MPLTQTELRDFLDYDPTTGIFRRKIAHPRFPIGCVAGSKKKRGHVVIRKGIKNYKAHRLAWLYIYGELPEDQIDHIDCDPGNNAINNLRRASNSQNHANCRRQANNTSGFKGVRKRRQSWIAIVKHSGRSIYLGQFDTPELAHRAYCTAAKTVFGEFARAA